MNIRDKVKLHCKLQGTTQKELAEKIGLKENTLNIILGKGNPQLATLEKIATGLNMSVSELLADAEPVTTPQVEVREVSYLRCPCCGNKINLWARAEEQSE